MQRSVYRTASFSVGRLRQAKFAIIYPDLRLDYKVQHIQSMLQKRTESSFAVSIRGWHFKTLRPSILLSIVCCEEVWPVPQTLWSTGSCI